MDDRAAPQLLSADSPDAGHAQAPKSPAFSASSTIKDTVESILVAFILAFIFRAFVVEAFVIPTGSMAPTLLGAHLRYNCKDCGYRFDANFQVLTDQSEIRIPTYATNRTFTIYCPNCGYRVPKHDPADPDNDAGSPRVHFGDRILVLKYLYLLQEPSRWDVVVFKSPADPTYQLNYIKRLAGLPGETIMILDGDVYQAWPGASPEQFQIQRKPDFVQQALWRIVYDNDHYPRQLPRTAQRPWEQPWKQLTDGTGWNLNAGGSVRQFHFDNQSGGATLIFDRHSNDATHALTDWLAYDIENGPPNNFVGDLKIAANYQRESGSGPFSLRLSKYGHRFTAEFTPDRVRLLHRRPDGAETVCGEAPLDEDAGPLRIEFANVDYRVSVNVDGRQKLGYDYHPDVRALLERFAEGSTFPPTVEIEAERQRCTLSHLSLWRDIYYLNKGSRGNSPQPPWGSPRDFPLNLIHLGPQEYFVLGDNTLVSSDSRAWDKPILLPDEDLDVEAGRVPGRFLMGKAFFVYWPAGHPPIEGAPAIVPNFGEMRLIR